MGLRKPPRYPNAAKSTGETDSEEERELQAERERLERLKATKEEQAEVENLGRFLADKNAEAVWKLNAI